MPRRWAIKSSIRTRDLHKAFKPNFCTRQNWANLTHRSKLKESVGTGAKVAHATWTNTFTLQDSFFPLARKRLEI